MTLPKTIRFAALALVFSLIIPITTALADYVPPVDTPPTCLPGNPGCEVPIHTGTAIQQKRGSVGLLKSTDSLWVGPLGAWTLLNNFGIPSLLVEGQGLFGDLLNAWNGLKVNGFAYKATPADITAGKVDLTAIFYGNTGADKYCDRNGQNCIIPGPTGVNLWAPGTGAGINDIHNTNTGKVGVGVAVPTTKLDISANEDTGQVVKVANVSTGANARAAVLFDAAAGQSTGMVGAIGPTFSQFPTWKDSMVLWANGAAANGLILGSSGTGIKFLSNSGATGETMRVTPDGRVGIGTTLPGVKLDVLAGGDGFASAWFHDNNSVGDTQQSAGLVTSVRGNGTYAYSFYNSNPNGQTGGRAASISEASGKDGIGALNHAYGNGITYGTKSIAGSIGTFARGKNVGIYATNKSENPGAWMNPDGTPATDPNNPGWYVPQTVLDDTSGTSVGLGGATVENGYAAIFNGPIWAADITNSLNPDLNNLTSGAGLVAGAVTGYNAGNGVTGYTFNQGKSAVRGYTPAQNSIGLASLAVAAGSYGISALGFNNFVLGQNIGLYVGLEDGLSESSNTAMPEIVSSGPRYAAVVNGPMWVGDVGTAGPGDNGTPDTTTIDSGAGMVVAPTEGTDAGNGVAAYTYRPGKAALAAYAEGDGAIGSVSQSFSAGGYGSKSIGNTGLFSRGDHLGLFVTNTQGVSAVPANIDSGIPVDDASGAASGRVTAIFSGAKASSHLTEVTNNLQMGTIFDDFIGISFGATPTNNNYALTGGQLGGSAHTWLNVATGGTLHFAVGGANDVMALNSGGVVTYGNSIVSGQIKVLGGNPGAGKVLTSDASGLASWQTPAAGGAGGLWSVSGNNASSTNSGNIGIGTNNPVAKLDVNGNIRATDVSATGNVAAVNANISGAVDVKGVVTANSGVRLNKPQTPAIAQPTCGSGTRGTMWFTTAATGDDKVEICMFKGGSYNWKTITTN